ncbi:hypothetical protein Plhal304r1_c014g0051441 [Plasmopara halstedii]
MCDRIQTCVSDSIDLKTQSTVRPTRASRHGVDIMQVVALAGACDEVNTICCL